MSSFKLLGLEFKSLVSCGLIALSFMALLGSTAQAQTAGQSTGQVTGMTQRVTYDRALITRLPSTTEDVGIAFLKMSDTFPDFEKVVEDSDAYKTLNPLAQQDYKVKTVNRLQTNFMTFQPKKSDLIIRVKVTTMFKKLPTGESIVTLKTFPNDPVYFPFYFAKYPIALVVKNMENFRELHLDKTDTDIVYNRLSLSGDATLLLQLYPIAANDTKPILLDNVPQYPMLAEIGYIGLLNSRAEQIWAWRNDKLSGKKLIGGDSRSLVDLVPADKQTQPSTTKPSAK